MRISGSTKYITIVTGLPRSGTSMMMRMLESGGMPVLVDHIREADEDNPNGYYEFEAVKQLEKDDSWLSGASGKAVKMVYLLLYQLPKQYTYRVIFMKRDLREVLASQKVMLERKQNAASGQDDTIMERIFTEQLNKFEKWVIQQDNIKALYVNYNDLLNGSLHSLGEIESFLDQQVNAEKMAAVLNPSLYRQRRV